MNVLSVNVNDKRWLHSKTLVEGRYYIEGYRDEKTGELVCWSKLYPDTSYAKIAAKGTIHYYVIIGRMAIADQTFDAGSYVRVENGQNVIPRSDLGCEVFCVYTQGYERMEMSSTSLETPQNCKLLSLNRRHQQWLPSRTGLPGRFSMRCWHDKRSDETVAFYKLASNTAYESIEAKGTVHYYVITGTLLIDDRTVDAASYVRIEAGQRYVPRSVLGCEVLCIYTKGFTKDQTTSGAPV